MCTIFIIVAYMIVRTQILFWTDNKYVCVCVCVCVRDLVPVCVLKYEHAYVCITRATLMCAPSGLQVLALVSRSLL